jgi:archaellum component FlaC
MSIKQKLGDFQLFSYHLICLFAPLLCCGSPYIARYAWVPRLEDEQKYGIIWYENFCQSPKMIHKEKKMHQEQFEQLQALFTSVAENQKKTDILLTTLSKQSIKTETEVAKTAVTVKKLSKLYGNMSNNQGAVAEQFYYNSLKANPVLRGIRFERIYKNMTGSYQKIQDEYDIVLVNSNSLFIIEVKYKAHPNDLDKLLQVKAPRFPILFNHYANFEYHLGLACFQIDETLLDDAIARGVNVLQRNGNIIETIAA